MRKTYEEPKMSVVDVDEEDVITASGNKGLSVKEFDDTDWGNSEVSGWEGLW